MFDERDYERANALAEGEIEQALEQHRQQMREAAAGSSDGTCQDCGQAIAPARLHAWPGARRCIDCQADNERRQKMTRTA